MIRRDVWSVKVYDSAVGAYCHSRMFYEEHLARKWSRSEPHDFQPNKIVHPADWVVAAFVAAGNKIEGRRVVLSGWKYPV